jgi:dTDP-4-amino-4,6-dideoxygalactose transaminase
VADGKHRLSLAGGRGAAAAEGEAERSVRKAGQGGAKVAVERARDEGGLPRITVMRPLLPDAARLAPYLARIDEARIYSNYGPLALEFERRIAALFGEPRPVVNSAASGTAALVGAILAAAGRAKARRPLALLPAYTFIATAAAVELCGYEPWLADVDGETWSLDAAALLEHPQLERVGVVVPVAPYGRPLPQAPWREFRARTGIPVVIDGAAGIDLMAADPQRFVGDIPVCLSFHATKSLACAEGGAVISTDRELAARVEGALNFGFGERRNSVSASLNGKLSEYHAAVGLAELDGWAEKLSRFRRVADAYRAWAAGEGLGGRLFATPDVSAVYALFRARDGEEAQRVGEALERAGIDWRLWYSGGLHANDYLKSCARDALPTTDALAPALLGLPMAIDLTEADVRRIGGAIAEGFNSSENRRG